MKKYSRTTETLLSDRTLGLPPKKKVFKNPKIQGKKVEVIDKRIKRYVLVCEPVLGWFMPYLASFTFGIVREEIAPEWYQRLVPEWFNPSVWLNTRQNFYTLRVPRQFKQVVKEKLQRRGFRFHTTKNVWIRGCRFTVEKGFAGALQFMGMEEGK